ncbi:MAG: zinc-ribbon domain-containing protein [Pseudomonas sp.]|nr:zinc-ribbon domain-containing protein [Pseudomonas sp.]
MIDSFVTQCPQCHTSFRVSRAQLGIAHGAVRCGACLHVFNAAQQLLSEQPALVKAAQAVPPRPNSNDIGAATPAPLPATPSPSLAKPAPAPAPAIPAQATPAGKQPSETLWIHDDLDLDNIDLDEALAQLEEQEHQLSQEFLALERAPLPAERFLSVREPIKAYDEEWAEQLLSNQPPATRPEPAPIIRQLPPAPVATQPPASLTPAPEQPAATSQPATAEPAPISAAEPRVAGTYAFLTDSASLELSSADQPQPYSPPDFTPLHAERDEPNFDEQRTLPQHPQDEQAAEAEQAIDDAHYRNLRQEPELRNEGLRNLAQEPLQLDWREQKKPWGRKLAWVLINLLALAALAGQYISYHFAELARQDQYRPWFAELCPELGCTLPSKVEIGLIKSSNLVVRSHPEFSGALVVDAILYNRAAFSQPFPLLELRFADLNGKLLASRSFKPSEYLAGELAGQAEMPPQTPIHISLDILDPGSKAVNYSLNFHSPE